MLLTDNRIPGLPGEVLLEEFLIPMRISQVALAIHLGIPVQRVNESVRGKRGIAPDTAWLLNAKSPRWKTISPDWMWRFQYR
jgi:addiction module HigA family antidote